MSIVSAQNGIVKVHKSSKPKNAVQLGFDDVPDFAFAPQLPTVNQFRKIRVPATNARAPPKGCDVPVKFLQEGDDYPRADSEELAGVKLKPENPKFGDQVLSDLLRDGSAKAETFNDRYFDNPTHLDYNAGIRPGRRATKFDQILEPTPQAFRP